MPPRRLMIGVETLGTLADHEQALEAEIGGRSGYRGIEQVTLATTTMLDGNVRYSSLVIVQVDGADED